MQNGQISILGMVSDNAILFRMRRFICLFALSLCLYKPAIATDFLIKPHGKPVKAGYFRLIEASPSYLITNCLFSLGWKAASDEMKDEDVWQIAVSYAQHPQFINMKGKNTKKLDRLSGKNVMWQSDMTWLFIQPHATDNSKNYSITGYKIWHINTDQQISSEMAAAFCSALKKHSKETAEKAIQDQPSAARLQ